LLKEKAMRITLTHSDITQAVIQYINTTGIDTTDKNVTVTFKAGRKYNGYSAIVDIVAPSQVEVAVLANAAVGESQVAQETPNLFGN